MTSGYCWLIGHIVPDVTFFEAIDRKLTSLRRQCMVHTREVTVLTLEMAGVSGNCLLENDAMWIAWLSTESNDL